MKIFYSKFKKLFFVELENGNVVIFKTRWEVDNFIKERKGQLRLFK